MSKITADEKVAGLRLDKFLAEQLPESTRSQIQKKIKSGQITVNQKKVSPHYFLKPADKIKILNSEPDNTAPQIASMDKIPNSSTQKKLKLKILDDTLSYLVINKPAGLLVHEAPGHPEETLVDQILKLYPKISKIGDDPMRPGIVHRLDKDVSGLLVIAKTQDMFDWLKQQFKSRKIKKEYIALVYGKPAKTEGEIKFNISRSQTTNYKMAAVPEHEQRGRKAITEFELVKIIGNYSLLNIKPLTGRTHQIRVHLNSYGLPIVGDKIYHPKKLKEKLKINRVFLHAGYLAFFDLNKQLRQYKSPLPQELDKIIKKLENSRKY